VVALTQGSEVRKPENGSGNDDFATEAFHAIGTLATITSFSVPQPGLMVIRCSGAQRFEISNREKLRHGLWIADVTRLDADQAVGVPEDLRPAANALGKLIKALQERAVPADQMPLAPPYLLDDCGWVANRWCELLPMPVELKQRLMELDNPLVRLELVSDILERAGIAM
jgi:Lon protease-like protein